MSKYKIGESKAFLTKHAMKFGEIVAIRFNKEDDTYVYDFFVEQEDGNWTASDIKEADIILLKQNPGNMLLDEWSENHIQEISIAFGKDMSGRCLVTYESFFDVEEELKEFFYPGSQYFVPVLGKWVGVLA